MSDIAITATSVLAGNATTIVYGKLDTGVTATRGQALYQKTNGNLGLADSNGTTPANSFYGFALSDGGPLQYITVATADSGTSSAYTPGGTVAAGDIIYLSDTPGAITKTYSDIASGSTVIAIGIVNTDLTLQIKPLVGGVK